VMPVVEVNSSDRHQAERLVEFVKREYRNMSPDAKAMFSIILAREIGAEMKADHVKFQKRAVQ